MKNKLLIAMLLASLTLTACGKDQASNTDEKADTKVEQPAEEKTIEENTASEESSDETVKIKDLTGEVEVRKNP